MNTFPPRKLTLSHLEMVGKGLFLVDTSLPGWTDLYINMGVSQK